MGEFGSCVRSCGGPWIWPLVALVPAAGAGKTRAAVSLTWGDMVSKELGSPPPATRGCNGKLKPPGFGVPDSAALDLGCEPLVVDARALVVVTVALVKTALLPPVFAAPPMIVTVPPSMDVVLSLTATAAPLMNMLPPVMVVALSVISAVTPFIDVATPFALAALLVMVAVKSVISAVP